jgi:hypothetical protein
MRITVAALLSVSVLTVGGVHAGSVAELAKANCIKAIMSSSAQVTRDQVAKFQFHADGSGYEMSGLDENHTQVSCKAAADGHVTWIFGG